MLAFSIAAACGSKPSKLVTDAATVDVATRSDARDLDADIGSGFVVAGTATGVDVPVLMQATIGGTVEYLLLTQDGPFALRHLAPDGTMVTLAFSPTQACRAPSPVTITGADANVTVICEGVAALTSVDFSWLLSAPNVFAPVPIVFSPGAFEPGVRMYTGTRPHLLEPTDELAITAVDEESVAALTIGGMPATSGMPSAPFPINAAPVSVDVAGPSGFSQTYMFALQSTTPQDVFVAAPTSAKFGEAVALDASTLVVGAPTESCGTSSDCGAAYVYTQTIVSRPWQVSTWSAAKLAAAPSSQDTFGTAVAISGATIVVGAPGGSGNGAAYVYQLMNGNWTLVKTLTEPSGTAISKFGTAVAIAGNTIAVGATANGNGSGGAVFVSTFNGTVWSDPTQLIPTTTPSSGPPGALLGASLAMTATTIVSGAPLDAAGGAKGGAVYVFSNPGTGWAFQQQVPNPNATVGDQFGASVDIDGNSFIVGSPNQKIGTSSSAGAAYAFSWNGTVASAQAPTPITSPSPSANALFGTVVGLDRNHAVVGQGVGVGSAYGYRFGTSWANDASGTLSGTSPFGGAVYIDGYTIVVGSPNRNLGNGAIDIFQ